MMTLFAGANLNWVEAYEEAQTLSKAQSKPIMLMYTMTGCLACKYMKEEVFTKPEIADYINKHFIPVEMDIDFDRIKGLKVYGTPTFYFHWDTKHIVKMIMGGVRPDAFLKRLKLINQKAQSIKP